MKELSHSEILNKNKKCLFSDIINTYTIYIM